MKMESGRKNCLENKNTRTQDLNGIILAILLEKICKLHDRSLNNFQKSSFLHLQSIKGSRTGHPPLKNLKCRDSSLHLQNLFIMSEYGWSVN